MGFTEELAGGLHGVIVAAPPGMSLQTEAPRSARYRDEQGSQLWLTYHPQVHLDLGDADFPRLRRDAERVARGLFDVVFVELAARRAGLDQGPFGTDRPRTDDPTWTPLIEIDRVPVVGGTALSVLQRLTYLRGHETVVGRTLVPVVGGLFEARWTCVTGMTGVRESSILIIKGTQGFLPQAAYDDPAFDASFPEHALSKARALKRWHEDGRLRVTAVRAGPPPGPIAMEPIGCAIDLPPRFSPARSDVLRHEVSCSCTRVSISGGECVEVLRVARANELLPGPSVAPQLLERASTVSLAWFEATHVDVACDAQVTSAAPAEVTVVLEGRPRAGGIRGRAVAHWFVTRAAEVWSISIASTVVAPLDELHDEVRAVARSWCRLPEGKEVVTGATVIDRPSYPREFGKYHLLGPLAQGGRSAYHLAVTAGHGLDRWMVIKTLHLQLVDAEHIARFRADAEAIVKLSHPNLIPVFDAGLIDGEVFLAMDFVEGRDLRAVWNRCAKQRVALPIDVTAYLVAELCHGLAYAHAFPDLHLVHRNVSPPKILISSRGEIKLGDFSLALSAPVLERTEPGVIYGKLAYLSPEQARDERPDGRADLYVAGIILWELLTGRQLFPPGKDPAQDLRARASNPEPLRPSQRAPRVPAGLDEICLQALAASKADRYADCGAMRRALQSWLAQHAPATDATRISRFLCELFAEDIQRERVERAELLARARTR